MENEAEKIKGLRFWAFLWAAIKYSWERGREMTEQVILWLLLALYAGLRFHPEKFIGENDSFFASTKDEFDTTGFFAVLGICFFIYLFISCYKLYKKRDVLAEETEKELRTEIEDYKERQRPKLKLSFDNQDAGCVRGDGTKIQWPAVERRLSRGASLMVEAVNVIHKSNCIYYRIKVECSGIGIVKNVSCRLLFVRRESDSVKVLDGEPISLTLAPADPNSRPDILFKDVNESAPEYIDAIALTELPFPLQADTKVVICTKNFSYSSSLNMAEAFSAPGNYLFHFVVNAPEHPSCSIELRLYWTGNYLTSKVVSCT